MNMKSFIARFPFPEWSHLSDDDTYLNKNPICICWYEKSEHGDITYGFKSDIAREFLNIIFSEVIHINEESYKVSSPYGLHTKNIYFYDDKVNYSKLKNEIKLHFLNKRKNEFLEKRGLSKNKEIERVYFSSMKNENTFDHKKINIALEENIPLLIPCFFTPEAGETLVFFDESIVLKIQETAEITGVLFSEYSDINDLPCP